MSRPRELKVGVVLTVEGVDHAFNNAAYLGLARAVHELSITGRALSPSPREGHLPSFSLLARQKYDLIIGTGPSMTNAVDAAAIKFPETTFALLDVPHDALEHRSQNVQGIVFSEAEAGYLAGYLAVRMVEREQRDQTIGSIGGVRVPAVENFIAGYQAGARKANPDVTLLNSYTDDFMDPAKGRSAALSQIANGSRVVFQVAGDCGLGVLQAAEEHGIWGIGVDVDESYLGPHVLTSAVKRLDAGVVETVRELQQGTLSTGGTSVFSLRDGGVDLGEISPEVPSSVLAELETIRSQIVAGEIAMPTAVT